MKKAPAGRCKYLLLVWENGGFVPSVTCEQPTTYKDKWGYLCERHQKMVAETDRRYSIYTDEEVVEAAIKAADHMAKHYRKLKAARK